MEIRSLKSGNYFIHAFLYVYLILFVVYAGKQFTQQLPNNNTTVLHLHKLTACMQAF